MDTSKIKNIIILILLTVNVCLGAVMISDRSQARAARASAWDAAVAAVEKVGISVSEDISGEIDTPAVYSARRDMDCEREWLEGVLGTVSADDLGGNIWFYTSENGQASVRGTGECDILFDTDSFGTGHDAEKTAARVMKRIGLEPDEDNAFTNTGRDGGIVNIGCIWQGCRVYNAQMSFTFNGDYLMMISGTRIFDVRTQENRESVMDELSVMMRFVEVVSEQGLVCSSLNGLEAGYVFSVTVSGEGMLNPVWRFTTDTGDVYINAVTGRVETVR